ncbi:hypothetical protein CBS101457_006184 [Exobasidium rhododendri]|nr:hypothetical protein CBS101457_006184 [Exobasidium rhododendri]
MTTETTSETSDRKQGVPLPSASISSYSSTKAPIRPEARRLHVEGAPSTGRLVTSKRSPGPAWLEGLNDDDDDEQRLVQSGDVTSRESTSLLQQAANYASLATLTKSSPSTASSSSSSSSTHATESVVVPTNHSTVLVPKRRQIRTARSGRSNKKSPPIMLLSLENNAAAAGDDVDGDCAPRLSISSAESSGESEIKTPESMTVPPTWADVQQQEQRQEAGTGKKEDSTLVDFQQAAEAAHHHLFQRQPRPMEQLQLYSGNQAHHDPQLSLLMDTPISPATADFSVRLAEAGYRQPTLSPAGDQVPHSHHIDATQRMGLEGGANVDAEEEGSMAQQDGQDPQTQAKGLSGLTPHSRTSTIRAKRPNTFLRLPSSRTDETARPSPPSTAGPTPLATADSSFGMGRNPMDDAQVTMSSRRGDLERVDSEDLLSKSDGLSGGGLSGSFVSVDDLLNLGNSRLDTFASPDSWRSLLPDNDPYFVSDEALSSSASSRSASLAGLAALHRGQSSSLHHGGTHEERAAKSKNESQGMTTISNDLLHARRHSNESVQSSFSLPGPVAASDYASCNASGSSYDMDGSYQGDGSRTAVAPLQYLYDQSSKSFASPMLLSPSKFGKDHVRASTNDESLGLFDAASANEAAVSRRHASFSAFDSPTMNKTSKLCQAAVDRIPSLDGRRGAAKEMAGRGIYADAVAPSSPLSSCAMGNEEDRESWPTSRNSMQGWQAGIANASQPHVQTFDPSSVDHILASQMGCSSLQDLGGSGGKAGEETVPSITGPLSPAVALTNGTPAGAMASGHHTLARTTTTTTVTTTPMPSLESHHLMQSSPSTANSALVGHPPPFLTSPFPHRDASPAKQVKAQLNHIDPASDTLLTLQEARPAPASTDFQIETHATHYTLKTRLPGFTLDGITLATKHHHQLFIMADKWDDSNGGHFEKRITFGDDADLRCTKAKFDGSLLDITVPRR